MLSITEKIFLSVTVTGVASLIGFAFYYASVSGEQHRLDAIACDLRGGIQLDRTYSYGKNSTGHMYTCVKKEMVIENDFEH